jgi:hypothetical protein
MSRLKTDEHFQLGEQNSKSLFHAPAIQALLIQCVAFLFAFILSTGIAVVTQATVGALVTALMQGVIATAISRWRRIAIWWLYIQFLFPIASVMMHSLHFPPEIFLIAFIFLVALYWSTFRTQVPFFPSGRVAWDAVVNALPKGRPIRFIDIGSGLGGLVLDLSIRLPESEFEGIEVAPLPWFISKFSGWMTQNNGRFMLGDYERLDFAEYDVIFAYLSPAAMPSLWKKAAIEMRHGALLLSYEFPIPGTPPDFISAQASGGPSLYGWYL